MSHLPATCLISVEEVCKKFSRSLANSLYYGARDLLQELLWFQTKRNDRLREDEFFAVNKVSFRLERGESLAIMGRNGAGKSTLLKLLMGRLKPTSGRIVTCGRIGTITDLGLGFDPSLTGRENIYIGGALLGLSRRETEALIEQIVEFAELEMFLDAPVRTYSTGMRARLGYSIAAHLNPDVLLVDEALAVGDIAFRRKCIHHVRGYLDGGGALIWVSHDPYLVQSVCNRCIVLEQGKITFHGGAIEGVDHYFRLGTEQNLARLKKNLADSPAIKSNSTDANGSHALAERSVSAEGATSSDSETGCGETKRFPCNGTPVRPEPTAESPSATPQSPVRGASSLPSGACPILIQSVDLVGEEGGVAQHGQPAEVVLRYVAVEAVAGVRWAFLVITGDLSVVISSAVSGKEKGFSLHQGRGELRCGIPALPLRAGTYALRAGMADCATGAPLATFGWENPPAIFSVVAEVSHDTNTYATIGDLVSMEVEWLPPQEVSSATPQGASLLEAPDA